MSFISLKKIIPAAAGVLAKEGSIISLVKPQFEVGRYNVGKGGIVKDARRIESVLEDIRQFGGTLGLDAVGTVRPPGKEKNKEYFILWKIGHPPAGKVASIIFNGERTLERSSTPSTGPWDR